MIKATKKITAAILSAVLVMSCAGTAFADGSPVKPDDPVPGVQEVDPKNQDTKEVKVSKDGKTIEAVEVDKNKETVEIGGNVTLPTEEGGTGKFPVNTVGSNALKGTKAETLNTSNTVTNFKTNALAGSKVKNLNSKVAKNSSLTFDEGALKNSNIKKVKTEGQGKTVVNKNTFKKTKVNDVSFNTSKVQYNETSMRYIAKGTKLKISMENVSKSKDVTFNGRVFGPRSKLFTMSVSSKMSDKEFEKLQKAAKAAGYQGKFKKV
jgi:hypothetical protein